MKREELKEYSVVCIDDIPADVRDEAINGCTSFFAFDAVDTEDVMNAYEQQIKELNAENARLKATISKMENVDERREYAYEMDIVIRWLDKNEDFVNEPNGKMQLLKSKAMHQKIQWLDNHPRKQREV